MNRIIEIRPFRGGWQCFEAEGVVPYWVGEQAKQDVIGYATRPDELRGTFDSRGSFNSSKPSLPGLADSRREEDPLTHARTTAASWIAIIVIMVSHYK